MMNKRLKSILRIILPLIVAVLVLNSCSKRTSDIEIGATFPLSGEVASAGQRMRNGVSLAVSQINKNAHNRFVKVIFEDDQNEPAQAVGNAKKFVDVDHVTAILGSAASGCTRAIMPYAIQRETVVLSPVSSSVSLATEGGGFFFRVAPADDAQAKIAAEWLRKQGIASVAIVFVNNDWGSSLAQSVKKQIMEAGIAVPVYEGILEDQKDMRTILEVVRRSKATILYSPTYPVDGGLLVRQAKELGLDITLLGGDNWGTPEFQTTAGSAISGCYVVKAILPSGHLYEQFENAYKAKYNEEPDVFATWSYDATNVLVDAIKRAGGKGGPALVRALRETSTEGASGAISFDKNGDLKNPRFSVYKYAGTQLVPIEEDSK